MIAFRHKNIDLEWGGWPMLCKSGSFSPIKLSYNGGAGWWIDRKIWLSYLQLKKILKNG
jgi:hypothetical protein